MVTWKTKRRLKGRQIDELLFLAVLTFLFWCVIAVKSPTFGSEVFDEFIYARAAAEECWDVSLSKSEEERFFDTLRLRAPSDFSGEDIAQKADVLAENYKEAIYALGCNSPSIISALRTWQYRVMLFAGFDRTDSSLGTSYDEIVKTKKSSS